MKKLIINLSLMFFIAIGGVFAFSPQPIIAQTTCTGGCTGCLGSECGETSGTECGKIQKVGEEEIITCYKSGGGNQGLPGGGF